MSETKILSKTLLVLYILTLLWLVLFKFSFDPLSVLFNYQTSSLNLIPFADTSRSEMISNFVVFIPFGLLLSATFKKPTFWLKFTYVLVFSLAVEMIQYIFAIGVTDVTDVIMNSLGGLLGLLLYNFGSKYMNLQRQDQFIVIAGMILLILFLLLRIFVFKVRY
jgi:glycopeptide antibiotics resistance protein